MNNKSGYHINNNNFNNKNITNHRHSQSLCGVYNNEPNHNEPGQDMMALFTSLQDLPLTDTHGTISNKAMGHCFWEI